MRQPKHFFVCLLPVVWSATCWLSYHRPGDEYGLWAVSSIAAWWGIWFWEGSVTTNPAPAIVAGAIVMCLAGWAMDRLRCRWPVVLGLWLVIAAAICVRAVSQYPTIERAMAKNGSWLAYIYASSNLGLTLASAVMIVVVGAWCIVRLSRSRPALAA